MARKVVWILGAGFSMPLGGPSLASLLSFETERSLQVEIPDDTDHAVERENILGRVARCTRWLYHYGTKFAANNGRCPLNGSGGETLWYDAEDFFHLALADLRHVMPLAHRQMAAERRIEKSALAQVFLILDFAPPRAGASSDRASGATAALERQSRFDGRSVGTLPPFPHHEFS